MVPTLKTLSARHFRMLLATLTFVFVAFILLVLPPTRLIALFAILIPFLALRSKRVRKYILEQFYVFKIETELLNAGIFLREVQPTLEQKHVFVRLPRVNVSITGSSRGSSINVKIKLSPYSRTKLETFDLTPIFDNYIQSKRETDTKGNYMEYRLIDIGSKYYYQYNSIPELSLFTKRQYNDRLIIDRYNSISATKHLIVSGITGSGKSYFLIYVIFVLLIQKREKQNRIVVCDIKQSDVSIIAREHLGIPTGDTKEQILSLIREVYEEMLHRQQYFKEYDGSKLGLTCDSLGLPHIYLLIDEQAAFVKTLDKKELSEFQFLQTQLLLLGRALGITVITGVQQVSVSSFGSKDTSIMEQYGTKISLGNSGKQSLINIFGSSSDVPTMSLPTGGGFLMDENNLNVAFFRTPQLSESFFKNIEKMKPKQKESE